MLISKTTSTAFLNLEPIKKQSSPLKWQNAPWIQKIVSLGRLLNTLERSESLGEWKYSGSIQQPSDEIVFYSFDLAHNCGIKADVYNFRLFIKLFTNPKNSYIPMTNFFYLNCGYYILTFFSLKKAFSSLSSNILLQYKLVIRKLLFLERFYFASDSISYNSVLLSFRFSNFLLWPSYINRVASRLYYWNHLFSLNKTAYSISGFLMKIYFNFLCQRLEFKSFSSLNTLTLNRFSLLVHYRLSRYLSDECVRHFYARWRQVQPKTLSRAILHYYNPSSLSRRLKSLHLMSLQDLYSGYNLGGSDEAYNYFSFFIRRFLNKLVMRGLSGKSFTILSNFFYLLKRQNLGSNKTIPYFFFSDAFWDIMPTLSLGSRYIGRSRNRAIIVPKLSYRSRRVPKALATFVAVAKKKESSQIVSSLFVEFNELLNLRGSTYKQFQDVYKTSISYLQFSPSLLRSFKFEFSNRVNPGHMNKVRSRVKIRDSVNFI